MHKQWRHTVTRFRGHLAALLICSLSYFCFNCSWLCLNCLCFALCWSFCCFKCSGNTGNYPGIACRDAGNPGSIGAPGAYADGNAGPTIAAGADRNDAYAGHNAYSNASTGHWFNCLFNCSWKFCSFLSLLIEMLLGLLLIRVMLFLQLWIEMLVMLGCR